MVYLWHGGQLETKLLHSFMAQLRASIVICTYNRERLLTLCLASIAGMRIEANRYELLVIDNNSKDSTATVCSSFAKLNPNINLRYILEPNQGIAHARTRGAIEAANEVIAYIDDDCLAHESWLQEILTFYESNLMAMSTGGRIIPKYVTPVAPWFGKYFWGLVGNYDLGPVVKRMAGVRYPSGANMHFRKVAFEKYGTFDGQLGRSGTSLMAGEEKAMYLKLIHGGEQVYYLPQAIVYHHVEGNKFDKAYVKRHSMGIGGSERLMNKNSPWKLIKKFVEYLAKLGFAIAYGLGYLIKGQPEKMWMLVKFRWWVIEGFFFPKKA